VTGRQHSEHTEAPPEPESPLAGTRGEGELTGALLALQRSAGNRAVGRLLAGGRLQRAPRKKPPPSTEIKGLRPWTGPPPVIKGGEAFYPDLISPPGQLPEVWRFVEPEREEEKRPQFAGASGYTESVAEEDLLRYFDKPPPLAETMSKRDIGTWAHSNVYVIQQLMSGAANPILSERLPPELAGEYTIRNLRLPWYRRSRIDRIDRVNGVIYEIKPDTRRRKARRRPSTTSRK